MAERELKPGTTVEKWLMPDPVAVETRTRALEALGLMNERGVRHLPVIDGSRRVVGLLSVNDLRAALPFSHDLESPSAAQREVAARLVVGDLMSHAPETVGVGEPLESAARRLAERHLGCLPVVDAEGRLLGLFSETDALRALVALSSRRGEVSGGELEVLVRELQRERWRLRRQLERRSAERRQRTAIRREAPGDASDAGEARNEEIVEEPLAALAVRRLAALDHALARAARGQLGVCEACGGAIAPARLRALPGTSLCVACARGGETAREGLALRPDLPAPPAPGDRVHTPEGEGRLVRIGAFGTCGACGETEGGWSEEQEAVLCNTPGCALPLTDVEERAVIELDEKTISVAPEQIRAVDAEPYD
jgi:CBS domain-containing protein/RNA polymerase-binding transcription factor DksA